MHRPVRVRQGFIRYRASPLLLRLFSPFPLDDRPDPASRQARGHHGPLNRMACWISPQRCDVSVFNDRDFMCRKSIPRVAFGISLLQPGQDLVVVGRSPSGAGRTASPGPGLLGLTRGFSRIVHSSLQPSTRPTSTSPHTVLVGNARYPGGLPVRSRHPQLHNR